MLESQALDEMDLPTGGNPVDSLDDLIDEAQLGIDSIESVLEHFTEENDYQPLSFDNKDTEEAKQLMSEFLNKGAQEEGFKSFNTTQQNNLPVLPSQEYLSKKQWYLLSTFYKKISHPTIFDCELLSSVLGLSWSVQRIQNWFQHERSRVGKSKYDGLALEPQDLLLWNEFLQVYSDGMDGQLLHQIQMAKQRAVILLSNSKTVQLWKESNYSVHNSSPDILKRLQQVYESDDKSLPLDSTKEAEQLSDLFGCNLIDVPQLKPSQIRKIIKPVTKASTNSNLSECLQTVTQTVDSEDQTDGNSQMSTADKPAECSWKESFVCQCATLNPQHVVSVDFSTADREMYYFENKNTKFTTDYVFVDQLEALATFGEYVDGVVIDSFLGHINAVVSRPVYFVSAKIIRLWQGKDPNMQYLQAKLDTEMMTNAENIYFPVNYHNHHWQLLEFNFAKQTIVLYDGKRWFDEPGYKNTASNFLEEYFHAINHSRKKIKFASWSYTMSKQFPIQPSGTECAPFLIRAAMDFAYMDNPAHRFQWSEPDMHYLRKLFTLVIYKWRQNEVITLKQLATNFKAHLKHRNKQSIQIPQNKKASEITTDASNISNKLSAPVLHNKSPVKSKTSMAHILTDFSPATCNELLVHNLLQLPMIDLLRLSILSRILISSSDGHIHRDYQKHIELIITGIDQWPSCTLMEIPDLKQSYFTLLLQSDFCFPTGNIRTDLGMALLCWTTRCCKSRNRCMLTLMNDLMSQQLEWKESSMSERKRFVSLKLTRTICLEEQGVFKFETVRNHCTRAWQAVYGVHSSRLNNACSPKKATTPKTEVWKQAVKQLSNQQIMEVDNHIEKTLLPNPFAPKGVKINKYVLPPHITSIHQLYWEYVWSHISSCPRFKANQAANGSTIEIEKLKRKFRPDTNSVQIKKVKTNTSSKGFTSRDTFVQSGIYRQLEKATELHSKFCECVVHYGSWYKHYNAKWNNEVVAGAFSKTWCQTCQNFIDESTRWHKFKSNQTEKSAKSQKYFQQKQRWKSIKEEWQSHSEHAAMERHSHELLRILAADKKLRLICFDFKTSLVCPYWGYHCAPNQVHYLSRMNAYFFGIVDEGMPDHFTGYIYPENYVDSIGPAATKKGSAHVIAMLYDFMQSNGLTDTSRTTDRELHFAADNCSGQNKNQYTVKFFCACVDLGWADDIKLDFMIPGHTKFGPDRWFGKIGKEIIKLDAWNIEQLIENVKKSVSYKETIKDLRNCEAKNFKQFLDTNYTKPKNLKVSENYHFWFSKDHPGAVRVRVKSEDPWSDPIQLRKPELKQVRLPNSLPTFSTIPLSQQRINVMRLIKKTVAHRPEVHLDYENLWDEWDFETRVFEVKEIQRSRVVNNKTQYRVKFKDDKYNTWSDDKYDEWLSEEQLEDAQKILNEFKSKQKQAPKSSTVLRIRGYDPEKQRVLIQWSLYPKEQDWTWESLEDIREEHYELLLPFVQQFSSE